MIKECPFANESCRYWKRPPQKTLDQEHGCFSDTDHIVPQRVAREIGRKSLAGIYVYSPENLQQMCRNEHDEKTKAGDEPLPERSQIIESLRRQVDEGSLNLSRRALRKLVRRDAKYGSTEITRHANEGLRPQTS